MDSDGGSLSCSARRAAPPADNGAVCESPVKRQKLDSDIPTTNADEKNVDSAKTVESSPNGSQAEEQEIFKNFQFKKVLKADSSRKVVFLHGTFDDGNDAVAILEKDAFDLDHLDELLACTPRGILEFQNDIYHNYRSFFARKFASVKTTLIYPATEQHLKKFSRQDMHIVEETADDYKNITLPLLVQEKRFSLQWVDNILDHKKEAERIVFENPDNENGFVLLPDLKWDGRNVESLYLIAVVRKRDLHSIRELTGQHLPMLKTIQAEATKAITEKYGLPASRIRAFFHYQPTFYHLHIHFTNIQYDAPGRNAEKAHMLTTVISNLEICSEFYKKATIPFLIGENDALFKIFAERRNSSNGEH